MASYLFCGHGGSKFTIKKPAAVNGNPNTNTVCHCIVIKTLTANILNSFYIDSIVTFLYLAPFCHLTHLISNPSLGLLNNWFSMKNAIFRAFIIANMLFRTIYSFKLPFQATRMRFSTSMRQTTMKLQTGIVGLPNVGKSGIKHFSYIDLLMKLAYLCSAVNFDTKSR